MRYKKISPVVAILAACAARTSAQTWNGGGTDNNWTTAANWVGGLAPANNATANVTMAGSVRTSPSVNTNYDIASLSVASGASFFTLSGSQLTLRAGGMSVNSGSTLSISNPIVLGAAQTWSSNIGSLINDTGSVNNSGFTLTVSGSAQTIFSAGISGTGGFVKTGSGTTSFAGSNTYTGPTTISSGTLSVNTTNGNTAIAGNIVVNGGTLSLLQSSNLAAESVITENGGSLSLAATPVMGGLLYRGGSLSWGGGAFTLSGTSTNVLSSNGAGFATLGFNFNFTGASGGGITNLDTTSSTFSGSMNFGGINRAFNVNDNAPADDIVVTGAISNGGLTKNGAGTLALLGTNTYSGGTVLNAGVVRVNSDASLGATGGALTFNGGTLRLSSNVVTARPVTVSAAGGTLDTNNNYITFTGGVTSSGGGNLLVSGGAEAFFTGTTDNVSLGMTVSGAVLLAKTSSSLVHAIGGGGLTVNVGGLAFLGGTGGDQIWDSANVLINGGGTLDMFGASETVNNVTLAGYLANSAAGVSTLSATSLTISGDATTQVAANGSLVINAPIKGTGTINANGYAGTSGNLVLNGSNTFSGNVTISGGTLTIGNPSALSNQNSVNFPDDFFGPSGTQSLALIGNNLTIGGLNSANPTLAQPIIQNGGAANATLTVDTSATCTYYGSITDGGSGKLALIKMGSGTLTLSGGNSFSGGWSVTAGTLAIKNGSALGSAAGAVTAGATLDLVGQSISNSFSSTGIITNSSSNPASVAGNVTLGGTITGTGDITFSGRASSAPFYLNSTSTVYFTGSQDNSGLFGTVTSGTLMLAKSSGAFVHAIGGFAIKGGTAELSGTGGDQIYDGAPVTITSGTLEMNGLSETIASLAMQGSGNGNGALQDSSSGSATLSAGSISLTGDTVIGVMDPAGQLNLPSPISNTVVSHLTKVGPGTLVTTGNISTSTSMSVASGTLIMNGGSMQTTLVNNATFIYNSGSFTGELVNAGNVTLNADFTASGGFENDSSFVLASGRNITLNGVGLYNQGNFVMTGGTLNLPVSGPVMNLNTGTFSLSAPLNLGAATFNNSGELSLSAAIISGNGILANNAAGTLTGSGTVTSFFTNSGTIAPSGGTLSLPAFTNNGDIEMSGFAAALSGGTITNASSIEGFGKINNAVTNNGTIEATGGNLVFSGAVTNSASGTIRAGTGTKVLMQGASSLTANAGLISLVGGTLDTSGHSLNNTGQITGYGVLSTGGLTNNGSITLTGGTTTVNGAVTNSSGKTINIKYQPAIFTGPITNNGTIKTTSTTVTFTSTYTGNNYISDPATNIFQNNVTIIPGGSMTGGNGDVFNFSGGVVTNNGTFSNGGTLTSSVSITNTGTFSQSGPQNWSSGTNFNNTAGTASFASDAGSSTSSPLTVNVSAGAVTFASTQHLSALNVPSGKATIAGNHNVLVLNGITVGASSTLDIGTNSMIVDYSGAGPSPVNSIRASIAAAYDSDNGGTWDLPGITSSAAANDSNYLTAVAYAEASDLAVDQGGTFAGQTISDEAVLVKYTYYGDSNMDGVVTTDDFFAFVAGFNGQGSGWAYGDYNYDGVTDTSDLFIFVPVFNSDTQNSPLSDLILNDSDLSASQKAALLSVVPEPTALSILAFGAGAITLRRRRKA